MAPNVVSKRGRKDKPVIFTTKGRSGHILTSRPHGTTARLGILVLFTFLVLMVIMSIYAISLNFVNAGVWGTLVLFAGGLIFLLSYEDNVFPSITRQKLPAGIAAWFFAFLAIPYLVMVLRDFNFAYLILSIIFLLPLALLLMRVMYAEEVWQRKKANFKEKTVGRLRRRRTSAKKRSSRTEISGSNRKRKIYRR